MLSMVHAQDAHTSKLAPRLLWDAEVHGIMPWEGGNPQTYSK